MVRKPKDGILGTDEGHLAYFKGLEEEGKSGKGRRLSKLHVCIYVRICRMHASLSTLKFFSRHFYLLDGPIYYSPYSPQMITVIVGVSRSGVYVGEWGGGCGDRCINALTRMQQQHTTDIASGPASSISVCAAQSIKMKSNRSLFFFYSFFIE